MRTQIGSVPRLSEVVGCKGGLMVNTLKAQYRRMQNFCSMQNLFLIHASYTYGTGR